MRSALSAVQLSEPRSDRKDRQREAEQEGVQRQRSEHQYGLTPEAYHAAGGVLMMASQLL